MVLTDQLPSFALVQEFMADRAVNVLSESDSGRLVLLAGVNDIIDRNGLPDRIARRQPKLRPFTVVPQMVKWDADGVPQIDEPVSTKTADWVWFTNEAHPLPSANWM